MRMILTFLIAALVLALPAQAGKQSNCTITPNPVSLALTPSWTVTASGGQDGVLYEIQLREGGVPRQDEGTTMARVYADVDGAVSHTFETLDYRVLQLSNFWPTLVPGTANVSIKSAHQGGGGSTTGHKTTLASCSFTVVE